MPLTPSTIGEDLPVVVELSGDELKQTPGLHYPKRDEKIGMRVGEVIEADEFQALLDRISAKVAMMPSSPKMPGPCGRICDEDCHGGMMYAADGSGVYQCPNRVGAIQRDVLAAVLAHADIPPRIRNATIDKVQVTRPGWKQVVSLCGRVEFVIKNAMCGVLSGPTGRGKTLACVLLLKTAAELKYTVAFTHLWKLVQDVMATYAKQDKSEQDVLQKYIDCQLLVIDDIGAASTKEATIEQRLLETIIDARWENARSTILSTNLQPQALREFLSDRVYWRIKERTTSETLIAFADGDTNYREKNNTDFQSLFHDNN